MIVYEYENNSVVRRELDDDAKSKVCGDIVSKWNFWAKPTESLKENRESVVDRIQPKLSKPKDQRAADDWKSKIELNRPYQFYSKLYGMLYETFYDKISSYINLGKDNYDKVYNKAFNIGNKKSLLVCIKDLLEYGELVASAELKNTYSKKIYPIEQIEQVISNGGEIVSLKEGSFIAREKTGEEINFIRINPVNFAYDPLVVPGTKDFDECDKIVKLWKTKQEILSNKSYEISKEELDSVIVDNKSPNMRSEDKWDINTVYRYNQVEVLTYYGNFIIDGKYYQDYVAVVVARAKLVYFKPKNLYTPGIYFYPYHAIGNGARGVSPLFYILDLCKLEQETLNDSKDFLELQKNPPAYTPIGFFEEEVTKIRPGLHITYKMGMQDPNAIIPLKFDANALLMYESATKQLTEEIAGIDNGRLSVNTDVTAEEVKRIAVNENLIPNMIISGILLNIVSKYLEDCIQITDGAKAEENLVKTAWEFANEQMQTQNIIAVLQKIGENDPSMVKLEESARKVFISLGVNPDDYLNDGRSQAILGNLANKPDEVLQKIFEFADQAEVQYNNEQKAATMMGQTQDSIYRKALRDGAEKGVMPESVIVPNGQGAMELPVVPVTPETQIRNRAGT